jgi:hypothetical protein
MVSDGSDAKSIREDCKMRHGVMIGTRNYGYDLRSGVHVLVSHWTEIARIDDRSCRLTWICKDSYTYLGRRCEG